MREWTGVSGAMQMGPRAWLEVVLLAWGLRVALAGGESACPCARRVPRQTYSSEIVGGSSVVR